MSFLFDIKALKEMNREDIRFQFGGKSLGLYEAFSLGLPIPETYLIRADWQVDFFSHHFTLEEKETVTWVERKIGQELAKLPKQLYAVRSSAQEEDSTEKSYAGIFETCLNVAKSDLIKAIAHVWFSSFSQRARFYNKGNNQGGMGIIIQPMIETKWAGIAFSKNPSPKSVWENQNIVIEFTPLPGEKIVRGEITPFCLSGTVDHILHSSDAAWIPDLVDILLILRKQLHHEVDIEFVVDNQEKVWLLQQRPISKIFPSHQLDLTGFTRKYKRSLLHLDIELLIEGCHLHLGNYLEVPFQLDRWMVMVTNRDGSQEIWTNQKIEKAVLFDLITKIEKSSHYLSHIQLRYEQVHQSILQYDYARFFDSSVLLTHRFMQFKERASFLEAHYYVPIFMVDALYSLLLKKMGKKAQSEAEDILFFLGTFAIRSIADVFQEAISQIDEKEEQAMKNLVYRYGFLKCRNFYEEGYSIEELITMAKEKPIAVKPSHEESEKYHMLRQRYFSSHEEGKWLDHLRYWMKVRNQEMEFLYFALHHCRKLYYEISLALSITPEQLWKSSSQTILRALGNQDQKPLSPFSSAPLVIYSDRKNVYVSDKVTVQYPTIKVGKRLKGKTIYGKGIGEYIVKIAIQSSDLVKEDLSKRPYVLVTGMTTPDFVPYLSSFAALITDEGGILCHAAIIAREIPIPCIVGTHNATECLQSGDQVQIDFDRSEVLY